MQSVAAFPHGLCRCRVAAVERSHRGPVLARQLSAGSRLGAVIRAPNHAISIPCLAARFLRVIEAQTISLARLCAIFEDDP